MKSLLSCLVATLLISATYAQNFLNGDFEINNLDSCAYNVSNSAFKALMPYTNSFGDYGGQIDVLNADCYFDGRYQLFGHAQSGYWYLALATSPTFERDAVSLETSIPLEQGTYYEISYYIKADTTYRSEVTDVHIGISTSDSTFGYFIDYGTPIPGEWTNYTIYFKAPIAAKYITVKNDSTTLGWNFIDNFTFIGLPNGLVNAVQSPINLYPNPAINTINIEVSNIDEIEIVNINGQSLFIKNSSGSNAETINITHLPSGYYIATIRTSQRTYKKPFIKIPVK